VAVCSNCGADVPSDQQFCMTCGTPAVGRAAASVPMPSLSVEPSATRSEGLAGFWWRVLSFVIDSIFVLIISELPAHYLKFGFYPTVVVSTVVIFLYWHLLVAYRGGQTLGMRIVRITIVNADGRGKVNPRQSAIRAAVYSALVLVGSLYHYRTYAHPTPAQSRRLGEEAFILFLLLVPHFLDLLWSAWDKQKQTVHDKAARTVAIRESKVRS
jgi:uncharacterized RDD family membrane protein YckC